MQTAAQYLHTQNYIIIIIVIHNTYMHSVHNTHVCAVEFYIIHDCAGKFHII